MDTSNQLQAINNNDSTSYTSVVSQVYNCVEDHLSILMKQLINTADKTLFDCADNAVSNEEQMKYMDCIRIFQKEKHAINSNFFVNLKSSLQGIDKNTTIDENIDPLDGLSLIDEDEMEEMVAITAIHAKGMNIYGEEVRHLEARLEYLELMCESALDKESIDPKHICEVFQKTIEKFETSIEVKLIFYKLFDQEVCSKLGLMYETINQMLIDNNIMPQILLTTTKQEEIENDEEEISSQVADFYDPRKKVNNKPVKRTNKNVSNIVNEFITGEMTIGESELSLPESFQRTPSNQDLTGKNCYDRKEVIKALSVLQNKLTSGNNCNNLTPDTIKKEIISDISEKHDGIIDKQVNLLDERSIDFVGMMFGAISDDDTVSEIMTNLIYQLQIPVMKVAMLDRSLFDDESHPARVTVDLLTEAGKGINAREDHLFDELESVVNTIIEKFDINIETFENAVVELTDIIKKEEESTIENERKQQKEILIEHAKNVVTTQVKLVSCDKIIPTSVRPLLLKHWSTLMLNRYLRHGKKSTEWLQSVLLLKLLFKCIQPIKSQSQFDIFNNNYETLAEVIQEELSETQQDQLSIFEQAKELKNLFTQMYKDFNKKALNVTEISSSKNSLNIDDYVNSDNELIEINQQSSIAKQKIEQLANTTRPGTWYEIYNGEDKPIRRLKLSVILTDTAQLIFVDRKGIKVIEKDAEEFAQELEDNRSRMIEDHSTFEHALGQVIGSLAA